MLNLMITLLGGAIQTCLPKTALGHELLVEAESFSELGGWVVDQQFMDLMGSPFLLAHGMGIPVADASTEVDFPSAGEYRVWVRTRDWVAPWKVAGAPGKFQLLIDGRPLQTVFGTEKARWHWQDGGTVTVGKTAKLTLHDLTGFNGRCDAILFSQSKDFTPPESLVELADFRKQKLGLDAAAGDGGKFDLVVIGGGIAGIAAAVTAARKGLTVALIQDRPVLGGNASSEVRVWPEGNVNLAPWPRIGDVVMEIVPVRRPDSKNAQSPEVFDDQRKLELVNDEPNLTLFLEQRMNQAEVSNNRVKSVVCQHVRSGQRTRIQGRWFSDCTGDGVLGYLAGADFDQTDKGHMGASNLWNIQCLCQDEEPLSSQLAAACEDASFPHCPWAVDFSDKPFPGRTDGPTEASSDPSGKPISLGNWFWESGYDKDPINDMEWVRDQNLRAAYGAWDTIKNVEKRYPAHRLNWVAYIAGKRESRRLLGDVILDADDLRDGKLWPDGCFPCTWGIDTHSPHPAYADGFMAGEEVLAIHTHGKGYTYQGPYWAPYRCLYSRNIDNLFMAGRNISVTHDGLGAVRVMKTCGAMGEIVGLAAAVCKQQACSPRDVYSKYLAELHTMMSAGAGKVTIVESDSEGDFQLNAVDARLHGTTVRYQPETNCLGYWRTSGDQAAWEIKIQRPGRYRVSMVFACDPDNAGGQFAWQFVTENQVRHVHSIQATRNWNDFQNAELGVIDITDEMMPPTGTIRLEIQNQKSEGPLMKLRRIQVSELKK